MKTYTYAGIGSRKTPPDSLYLMATWAHTYARSGYTLRSGGASGADSAFERAHRVVTSSNIEIFRPQNAPEWTFNTVERFHPNPKALTPYVRALHARNAQVVLGTNGDNPVDFIVCWTPGGEFTGGTGQALRIARHHDIPIYNLATTQPPEPE